MKYIKWISELSHEENLFLLFITVFVTDRVQFLPIVDNECLTHVCLILERESTSGSSAVEVRRPLSGEWTVIGRAALGSAKSLKTLLYYRGVFAMVIRVHLHVRRRYVNLVAVVVYAVIMGLLAIVRTRPARVSLRTVVGRRVTHKTVLQRFVALLVPLEVPYHLFLLDENPPATVETVKVFPAAQFLAVRAAALLSRRESTNVTGVVDYRLRHSGFRTYQILRHGRHALPK